MKKIQKIEKIRPDPDSWGPERDRWPAEKSEKSSQLSSYFFDFWSIFSWPILACFRLVRIFRFFFAETYIGDFPVYKCAGPLYPKKDK